MSIQTVTLSFKEKKDLGASYILTTANQHIIEKTTHGANYSIPDNEKIFVRLEVIGKLPKHIVKTFKEFVDEFVVDDTQSCLDGVKYKKVASKFYED